MSEEEKVDIGWGTDREEDSPSNVTRKRVDKKPTSLVEDKVNPLENVGEGTSLGRGKPRRSFREQAAYANLNAVEREQAALDKLNGTDFLQNVFTRLHFRETGEDITDKSHTELLDLFAQRGIDAYHNTYTTGADIISMTVGDMSDDNEYRADYTEVMATYRDAPSFGEGTIGLAKWMYHFLPALTYEDPVFWASLGFGKWGSHVAKKEAMDAVITAVQNNLSKKIITDIGMKKGKTVLTEAEVMKLVSPKELAYETLKKTLKYTTLADGGLGFVAGAGFDASAQLREMEVGLTSKDTDFDSWRMIKHGLISSGLNALTSGTITYLSSKGAISRYYKDPETGFLKDLKHELTGTFASTEKISYSVSPEGLVVTHAPTKVVKNIETTAGKVDPVVIAKKLENAKPRYYYGKKQIDLAFEDEISKALYIVSGKGKSASHDLFVAFLKNSGVKNINTEAAKVRAQIKQQAKDGNDSATIKKFELEPSKPKEVAKPDESPTIIQKSREYNRTTDFVNYDKIDSSAEFKLKVQEILEMIAETGSIRTDKREGLLKWSKENGLIIQKDSKKLADAFDKFEKLSKLGDEAASLKFAIDLELIGKIDSLKKHTEMLDHAVTPKEKETLAELMMETFKDIQKKAKITTGASTVASDIVQSGRIMKELSLAKQHQLKVIEIHTENAKHIERGLEEMTPIQQIESLTKLADTITNPFKTEKVINAALRKHKDTKIGFGEALNEVITGGLLLDVSTHVINISGGVMKHHTLQMENKIAGVIHMAKNKGNTDLLRMLNDVDTTQKFILRTAWDEAMLTMRIGRNVGDVLEHKFDNPRVQMMDAYLKQSKESGNIANIALQPVGSTYNVIAQAAFRALGFEDVFLKALVNRAYRVAHVNHRMRKFYPELMNKDSKITQAGDIVGISERIKGLQKKIWFEEAKTVPDLANIKSFKRQKQELQKELDADDNAFKKKYRELYYQYEDEFGNWQMVSNFGEEAAKELDSITKSMAYDPTFVARETLFQNNPRKETLNPSQFFPDQTRSPYNLGATIIEGLNGNTGGYVKFMSGMHFMKTPNNLIKDGVQRTPALQFTSIEWWKLMNAKDPLVKTKAQAATAFGIMVAGLTYMMVEEGETLIINNDHPDIRKRFNLRFIDEETGEETLLNLNKLVQIAPIFLSVGAHVDAENKLRDINLDENYSQEKNMMYEALSLYVGNSMDMYATLLSNQLYFEETIKNMQILLDPNADGNLEKAQKYLKNLASKSVPAATFSRFTNRALADAQLENETLAQAIMTSTPYELIELLNERFLDNAIDKKYLSDMSAVKRDILGNVLPAKAAIHVITTPTPLSALMTDRNGKTLKWSLEAKNRLLDAELTTNIRGMQDTYRIKGTGGMSPVLELKHYEVVKLTNYKGDDYDLPLGFKLEHRENANLYEIQQIVLNNLIHHDYDRTLNEQLHFEMNSPNSDYNMYYRENRMDGGIYEGGKYIADVINKYYESARAHVHNNVSFKYGGKVTRIVDVEEEIERNKEITLRQ